MNIREQNDYLFNLMQRLYLELGVYIVFTEFVKSLVGDRDVDQILGQCRRDPALESFVVSYCEVFQAALPVSEKLDPDQAMREFVLQCQTKGRPD